MINEKDITPIIEGEKKGHLYEVKTSVSTQEIALDDDEIQRRIEYAKENNISPDDLEYVLDKVEKISLEEAKEILKEIVAAHKDDINFDKQGLEKLNLLANSGQPADVDPADYEFEVKSQAAICKYFSPYPEVRSVTRPYDDPTMYVETFRAHLLGYVWAIIGQYINSFFNSRWPQIKITSAVCQTLLYPCGLALAKILPDWGITIGGTRHSLNPGPWNFKEQMVSTICFNVCITSVYVFWNIQTQTIFYEDKWLTAGYKILLILSTQCMGFGFAGILRRFVVYPIETFWPSVLPALALNKSLLIPEKKGEVVHGWKIQRYHFFFLVFASSFLWYWVPGYLFQGLSYFSWMTWIAPDNFNLAMVTGTQTGLGLNPLPSFDWNIINFNYPLTYPFYTTLTTFVSMLFGACVIWGLYYTNNNNTAYLPINSSALFTNTGEKFKVSKIITNGQLDEEKYKNYSPPYYTAANLLVYSSFFLSYPLTFCYVLLDQYKLVARAYVQMYRAFVSSVKSTFSHLSKAFKNLFSGDFKGFFAEFGKVFVDNETSIYDGFDDPFTNMMRSYPEVPDLWFYLVLLVAFIFAIILLSVYTELNTPKWTIFFVIAINLVFLIPMNILSATTGTTIGLNVLVELIVGYALPGNGEALMFVKAYGYQIDGSASSYTSDQKMAHYTSIPPRAVFRVQIIGSIISCFIGYSVVDWVDAHIKNICTAEAQNHFTCANGSQIYYSASVVWGMIGPERIFSQQYPIMKYMFLFGFLLAVAWWAAKKFGPAIRESTKAKAPPAVYKTLNALIFYPLSWLKYVHPSLIVIGFLNWAPYNLSYFTVGTYLSAYFMYYLRRYKTAWWEKYNYVLSAGLDSGLAFSAIILFFAVQFHDKPINWWGNNVILEGVDGGSSERSALYMELPAKGYFGPDEWS